MSKLAWFFALFAAGLALLFTPPEGAALPASARERDVRPSELSCPFELSLDGVSRAGHGAEEDKG